MNKDKNNKGDNMKIKKAFTMAEAILVMTILGIIAAVMITTLKPAEFKEKSLNVLAKKVLSEIDNATTQVMVNDTKLGTVNSLVNSDGTSVTFANNAIGMMSFYKKYLTTIRTEVPSTSFCVNGGASYTANAVYFKDGACMGIYASAVTNANTIFPGEKDITTTNAIGLLLFDTNGEDEPNTVGKDRFILPIGNEGIQYN